MCTFELTKQTKIQNKNKKQQSFSSSITQTILDFTLHLRIYGAENIGDPATV